MPNLQLSTESSQHQSFDNARLGFFLAFFGLLDCMSPSFEDRGRGRH